MIVLAKLTQYARLLSAAASPGVSRADVSDGVMDRLRTRHEVLHLQNQGDSCADAHAGARLQVQELHVHDLVAALETSGVACEVMSPEQWTANGRALRVLPVLPPPHRAHVPRSPLQQTWYPRAMRSSLPAAMAPSCAPPRSCAPCRCSVRAPAVCPSNDRVA